MVHCKNTENQDGQSIPARPEEHNKTNPQMRLLTNRNLMESSCGHEVERGERKRVSFEDINQSKKERLVLV